MTRSPVADGWERAWHDHLERVVVGSIAVRPPWIAGRDDDLVIEPGLSFGAAAHPTTRMCLALLQELPRTGLADWGCGSGVLAIAAARLGFAPVVGVELDPAAASVARDNARANGVEVEVCVGDVTRGAPLAPTVVANLDAAAAERASPGRGAHGRLRRSSPGSRRTWPGVVVERRELDGWAALVLERS